ncbi:MAG: CrcB protein [Planctomycetota bacterium]|jgi:CrcB protein
MVAAAWVGLGGMLGALLRYGVGLVLQSLPGGAFPAATLMVNVLGCLALGYLLGSHGSDPRVSESMRLFLGVGLLGAFTTFSTFGVETVNLVQGGNLPMALASVGLNLALGFAAVLVGVFLGA